MKNYTTGEESSNGALDSKPTVEQPKPLPSSPLLPKPQEKPLVDNKTPKYDQALILCSVNGDKGTIKVIDIVRKGIVIAESLVISDNKLADQHSNGMSKYWFVADSVKVGDIIPVTEGGTGNATWLILSK